MLPKFRSFIRPIIRSFIHSFIVHIHSSFIVPIHRLSFVHTSYSPSLFTITIHCYYLSPLFAIITIHWHYSSSLLFVGDIYGNLSSLQFIDHPITPNFNYSSIMLSSPPKTSQTHIPVIRTLVTVIFLPVGTFPSGHPSQVSPSWAHLTLRFLRIRLPNSDSNSSCF
jgi:hypothetical protein